jgi:beta-glucuronidase
MHSIPTWIILSCLCLPLMMMSQTPNIQNVEGRSATTLNGKWNIIIDPYENGYYDYRYLPKDQSKNPGADAYFTNYKTIDKSERVEYNFDRSPTLLVPRDWNSQKETLLYYEGTVWYKKSFDYRKSKTGNRVFVRFGGANYRADVYLNGKKLGFHEGGFTPFEFEITKHIMEKDNFLIVKVDNKRKREGVPTLNTDWWNYGGITRDVDLVETPAVFIKDYFIRLKNDDRGTIIADVQLNGGTVARRRVELELPELKLRHAFQTDDTGHGHLEFSGKGSKLWSPDDPILYSVTLRSGDDSVSDKIGFRSIETKGRDILLNGKPIFLRGISIHEENPMRGGRACTVEDARLLLGWAKELNCNFVRLAHYPHNEHMIRLADEMGIMVWEEIPVYWTIQWENEETIRNAENQLRELVMRDRNRACSIIWSMANETPLSDTRLTFLRHLTDITRELDDTRLVSAALEKHALPDDGLTQVVDDPFGEIADVLSFNEYVGWYDGLPEKCEVVQWRIAWDKPVIISEFGADALQGMHGDKLTRWSEEYQEDLYRRTIAMLKKIPQLRGMTPWILTDFRSPRRVLPGIQDGWNRKGLISETGEKKLAFKILQTLYRDVMDDTEGFIVKLGE